MTAAIRSALTGSVVLAGAAAIAVGPVSPTPDLHLPRLESVAVSLTGGVLPVPPLGAIPYQALVNGIADVIALAPIVFGSTEQCTTCLGPTGPGIPFTGWGLVGIGTGLLTSPVAFVQTLIDTADIGQALGVAGLALQTPITNTLRLLGATRLPNGGFELQGVLDRAFNATKDVLDYAFNIAAQALVTGPLEVLTGVVAGAQLFVGTLAQTGDIVAAFNAGAAPIRAAVTASVDDLVAEVEEGRATVWADLKTGPGKVASPIPTIPLAPLAATREEQAAPVAAASTKPAAARRAATGRTPLAAAAAPASKQTATAGAQPAGAVKAAAGSRARATRA